MLFEVGRFNYLSSYLFIKLFIYYRLAISNNSSGLTCEMQHVAIAFSFPSAFSQNVLIVKSNFFRFINCTLAFMPDQVIVDGITVKTNFFATSSLHNDIM